MRQKTASSLVTVALMIIGLFAAFQANAVGLGSVEVQSRLNEPLRAEIPLLSLGQVDVDSINVRLAEAEDFRRIGLDRRAVLTRLEFGVDMSGPRPVVRVTSDEPVREPFLSFLVRMDWPQGRMLREYTILLDPPVMAPAAAPRREQAPAQRVERETPEAAQPERRAEPVSQPQAPAREPAARPRPEPAETPRPAAGEYGPVRSGETLWRIANDLRPGEISVNQMMLALLRTNPEAFFENNINALKSGAVLRVPDRNEITRLNLAEAREAVVRQNDLWQDYRRNLAREAPAVVEGGEEPAPSREPAATPEADSRLELVPPRQAEEGVAEAAAGAGEPGEDVAAERDELRSDLARAQEELLAEQQQSDQLEGRVGELEDQVDRLQRLLEMKNQELAALQAQAEESQAGEAGPAPVEEEPDAIAEGQPAAPEQEAPDLAQAEEAADAGDTAEEDASEPATTPPPRAPSRPGWMEMLLSPVVVGALGLLLLGIGVALFLHRRRDSDADTTLRREAVVGGDRPEPEPEPEPEEESRTGDLGPPEAGPADYDAAALQAALEEDPGDTDTRLKLMRHYAATRDEEAFVAQAETLYAQLANPSDPAWLEARRLGEEVAPDNALFTGDEDIRSSVSEDEFQPPAPASEEETEEPGEQTAPATPGEEAAAGDREPSDELPDLEFDLPEGGERGARDEAAGEDAEAEGEDEAGREYSLEDLETGHDEGFDFEPPAAPEEEATDEDVPDRPAEPESEGAPTESREAAEPEGEEDREETLADFDFSELDTETGEEEKGEQSADAEPDLEVTQPTGGEPATEEADQDVTQPGGEAPGVDEDAVSTKLELAEAYMDMGDEDGARDLLEEVVKEGNDDQQAKAKEMLDKLG